MVKSNLIRVQTFHQSRSARQPRGLYPWCVLAARAFNRVYDLKLTVRGEMDLAYHGEITTPSQCGRMDQCCAFGARLTRSAAACFAWATSRSAST